MGECGFFLDFAEVKFSDRSEIGGKAYFLGRLSQSQIPVPPGCILRSPPASESDWETVIQWWRALNWTPLAVRSSAAGEDSASFSFAGQNQSFLNISTQEDLKRAVLACFASIGRAASRSYREHFLGRGSGREPMNVILQQMVSPQYSGVFFSSDPSGHQKGWVIESISGLGEELVSGHVTPARFTGDVGDSCFKDESLVALEGWMSDDTKEVLQLGQRVKRTLDYDLDMEWAKDNQGKFWVLQARPITTLSQSLQLNAGIKRELKRLQSNHSDQTLWDGQTFAEWTGLPTPVTFSVWKRAFRAQGAFGKALSDFGYLGSRSKDFHVRSGILESVFGRGYINSKYLDELYFGSIAYATVAKPHPHLEFFWDRINLQTVKAAPGAMLRMVRVAWQLQTSRREMIRQSKKDLEATETAFHITETRNLSGFGDSDLLGQLDASVNDFTVRELLWPFKLILLAESTLQTLRTSLSKVQGEAQSEQTLQRWMGLGIHTLSLDMDRAFSDACRVPLKRTQFLADFGHRGPGELDLSSPRWVELGDASFPRVDSLSLGVGDQPLSKVLKMGVDQELTTLQGIYSGVIRQEWELLKELLELREIWKSQILKSYMRIRQLLLEVGKRAGLKEDVFWLKLHEAKKLMIRSGSNSLGGVCQKWSSTQIQRWASDLIARRKSKAKIFSQISLPGLFTLAELRELTDGHTIDREGILKGDGISPGLGYGEVRIVRDPNLVDFSTWPSNAVLVAEATDPGWTPLFLKAKAIVVEKGGVLSHCAIVAREMGLPAVSGILGCSSRFREGDHVWVDGSNGTVRKA